MASKCKKTSSVASADKNKTEKIGLLSIDQFEKLLSEGTRRSKSFIKKFDSLYNIDDSKLNMRMK